MTLDFPIPFDMSDKLFYQVCQKGWEVSVQFSKNIYKNNMVGPSGLEPPTSRLSGVRSNQLSYGPDNYII